MQIAIDIVNIFCCVIDSESVMRHLFYNSSFDHCIPPHTFSNISSLGELQKRNIKGKSEDNNFESVTKNWTNLRRNTIVVSIAQ